MVEKMKIGISAISAIRYGSVTYLNNLIRKLAEADRINEYHIFTQSQSPVSRRVSQPNFRFHECPVRLRTAAHRFLWEQLILPRELKRKKIDILFTAKNVNTLFAPCRTIISIQNMEPLGRMDYNRDWRLKAASWLRRQLTFISIKKADRVIVPSNAVKTRLVELFPGTGDKIDVIYNGNPVYDACPAPSEGCKNDPPYLLSASKFAAYSNQQLLIEGYLLLSKRRKDLPPLLIAGGVLDNIYFKKVRKTITENGLTGKVRILGHIEREELLRLYRRAAAFIFPSVLEAGPQTLVEAMACGVPIAASNIEPMPEICQEAAVYFKPFDKNDIADKIDLLLSNASLRQRLKESSLLRCRFFDWDKKAMETIKVFQKVYA